MTHPTDGTDDARDAVARHEVERRLSEEEAERTKRHIDTLPPLSTYDAALASLPADPPYVPPSLRAAERHRQGRTGGGLTAEGVQLRHPYDLDNIFTYHPPIGDQPQRYRELREKAKEYAELVMKLVPASPERTLALRQIELAVFWHNAAISRNEGPGHGDEGETP